MLIGCLLATSAACAVGPRASQVQEAEGAATMTEDQVVAYLNDYVDRINTALEGDGVSDLAEVTDPDCPCSALVTQIKSGTGGNGGFIGARFTAEQPEVLSLEGPTARVRAHISISKYTVKNTDGIVVARKPAAAFDAVYTLHSTTGGGWAVTDVQRADQR